MIILYKRNNKINHFKVILKNIYSYEKLRRLKIPTIFACEEIKVDDKAKEEKKKKEEEDNFLYEIDEYFYKILELFNSKKFDKLDYEKEQFKRVLIYLANFKRKNFIEFLKMTNISKYTQVYTRLYTLIPNIIFL